ncbi:hypothetical protein [Bacillus testis]|uniref:hypothetical protein n=1 Tax=Bacillus testis TaxID=1622072 RepID=UPI00067F1048|nr:hypothetical protein [Bacillus testis]
MDTRQCTYCKKKCNCSQLTPMQEKRSSDVHYYCERCLAIVKKSMGHQAYSHLFAWGKKGDTAVSPFIYRKMND